MDRGNIGRSKSICHQLDKEVDKQTSCVLLNKLISIFQARLLGKKIPWLLKNIIFDSPTDTVWNMCLSVSMLLLYWDIHFQET